MSCILRFIYHDVIQPGDTFTMMMRKMVMALSAIAGNVCLLSVLYFTTKPRTNETRAIYFYSLYISGVVILISSWIYVKWTHTAPTWLMVFWTNSMSVIVLINLSTPNAPSNTTQIAIIICVLLCKVHSVNLTVPVTALLIFCYNSSLGRMGAPYPLLMLLHARDLKPDELVSSNVIFFSFAFN